MRRLLANKFVKRLIALLVLSILVMGILWIVTTLLKSNKTDDVLSQQEIELQKKNTAVMQNIKMSSSDIKAIDNVIKTFINACNTKDYISVEAMLSEEYKTNFLINTDKVKEFCNREFNAYKLYNYQNILVNGNKSIYEIKIYDDIMTNSVTDYNGYSSNVLNVVIVKNLDGSYKFSLDGYIDTKKYDNIIYEDNEMLVQVIERDNYYKNSIVKFKIKNKTNDYINISNTPQLLNIKLKTIDKSNIETEISNKDIDKPFFSDLNVYPNFEQEMTVKFNTIFDFENIAEQYLVFENIKIIPANLLTNLDMNTVNNISVETNMIKEISIKL